MKIDRFSKMLFTFVTIVISIITLFFILKKEYRFIYNAIFIYIFAIILLYLETKEKIKISKIVKVLLFMVVALHLIGGQYFNLYKKSYVFDKLLHLLGSYVVSRFFYDIILFKIGKPSHSSTIIFLLVACIGVTSGVVLELLEFSLDTIFNTLNQRSLVDTNFDLIFNFLGSSIAAYRIKIKY